VTSGLYIARPVRSDTQGASHILFVVRDDAGGADILFQTSDTTWQAYNTYGGDSLYGLYHINGWEVSRAYKVSYNRPITTRGTLQYYSLWTGEYPMIRWLEANGYDMSYASGVDTDRYGSQLTNQHKLFLSAGHDEYWSPGQRANVKAARDAGLNLAFFSGNEMFWKTRWETSIDGTATPHRTLVCYKETHAGAKIDPSPQWTGTWRDPRFSPPSDGGQPENEITGTLYAVNGIASNSLAVPAAYGKHRFWRNTSVATLTNGQTAVFAAGTLGFEWDQTPDNGFQPPGQMRLSLTTAGGLSVLQDYGSTYASGQQATHSLSLYRAGSGALVFGAGTVQWGWGLDSVHANGSAPADARMQQATVNLFADMGIQPGSLQPGLTAATQSADITPPVSSITSPAPGATVFTGSPVTISGTATDSGGLAWGVEISTDGGATWHPATGQGSWSYSWTPPVAGGGTIRSRAVDDSGNLETPSAGINVTVAVPVGGLGVIGNTNNGTSTDAIWDVEPYINATRFQAASNMTVALMRAKVQAISGSYKCAIYSESNSQPGNLLRSTTPVTGPATGWQTFALTESLGLANGGYYWLAIWSDDAGARVYYSDTVATLRWGQYNYGAWPDPLVTTGGGNATYCIYATGGSAPAFAGTPTNRTVAELTAMTVTNAATDADVPAQTLAYSLVNAPTNAVISTNGVITWMPGEAQGPSTNLFTTVVSDGLAGATNTFEVVVTEVNVAPVADSQSLTNAEDAALAILLTGSDGDGPVMNFVVVTNPAHGTLSGTAPNLTYQPVTNYFGGDSFAFRVDDGSLTSAVATVAIALTNVNDAPELPAQTGVQAGVFVPVLITNAAADVDSPSEGLTYTLLTGTDAVISTNGLIAWTPKGGPGTNLFTTIVQDGGAPELSATNAFYVVVTNTVLAPVIESLDIVEGVVTVSWSAMSNGVYRLQYLDDFSGTNWLDAAPDVTAAGDTATATNTAAGQPSRFYRVRLVQ
jgi:hypothetical protein